MQNTSPLGALDSSSREQDELFLQLRPHEEAAQLFGSHASRPRAAERIEDQVTFSRRGEQRPAHQ